MCASCPFFIWSLKHIITFFVQKGARMLAWKGEKLYICTIFQKMSNYIRRPYPIRIENTHGNIII